MNKMIVRWVATRNAARRKALNLSVKAFRELVEAEMWEDECDEAFNPNR